MSCGFQLRLGVQPSLHSSASARGAPQMTCLVQRGLRDRVLLDEQALLVGEEQPEDRSVPFIPNYHSWHRTEHSIFIPLLFLASSSLNFLCSCLTSTQKSSTLNVGQEASWCSNQELRLGSKSTRIQILTRLLLTV